MPRIAPAANDTQVIIELVGKKDSPTDGVDDYTRLLNAALQTRGMSSDVVRVPWDEIGWFGALRKLWHAAAAWQRSWVLVQYTALMWSRRGFPVLFFVVLCLLKLRGAHIAVVFHDPEPYRGSRRVDAMRGGLQRFVMRCGYKLSKISIFNVPPEHVSWLPRPSHKASFVPVGANLPVVDYSRNFCATKTIAVFTVTDGGDISKEVSDIALAALKSAERFSVRLVTVGRGSVESRSRFQHALNGSQIEYRALGVVSAQDVAQVLAKADVSLFVRGPLSTHRGSAIASIANAVPLVVYADTALPAPLAEAGVVAVPYGDAEELANATVRVLGDCQLWSDLHQRSRCAYQKYFSWDAVAGRLLEVLQSA